MPLRQLSRRGQKHFLCLHLSQLTCLSVCPSVCPFVFLLHFKLRPNGLIDWHKHFKESCSGIFKCLTHNHIWYSTTVPRLAHFHNLNKNIYFPEFSNFEGSLLIEWKTYHCIIYCENISKTILPTECKKKINISIIGGMRARRSQQAPTASNIRTAVLRT